MGIDRILNEGRVFINVLGNAVATIVIGKWEDDFDHERARQVLSARHEEFDDVELDDVPPHHHGAHPVAAGAAAVAATAPQTGHIDAAPVSSTDDATPHPVTARRTGAGTD